MTWASHRRVGFNLFVIDIQDSGSACKILHKLNCNSLIKFLSKFQVSLKSHAYNNDYILQCKAPMTWASHRGFGFNLFVTHFQDNGQVGRTSISNCEVCPSA